MLTTVCLRTLRLPCGEEGPHTSGRRIDTHHSCALPFVPPTDVGVRVPCPCDAHIVLELFRLGVIPSLQPAQRLDPAAQRGCDAGVGQGSVCGS